MAHEEGDGQTVHYERLRVTIRFIEVHPIQWVLCSDPDADELIIEGMDLADGYMIKNDGTHVTLWVHGRKTRCSSLQEAVDHANAQFSLEIQGHIHGRSCEHRIPPVQPR